MEKQICLASTLVLAVLIYIYFFQSQETKLESYSDYHINYPKDFYPQLFPETQNKFLQKIPYDDTLSTRHYRKRYYNRITPECQLTKSCPKQSHTDKILESPGFAISTFEDLSQETDPNQTYFKSHLNYYEDQQLLKQDSLGYSIEGVPYADYKFNHPKQPTTLNNYLSNRIPDLKEPEFPDDYPEWFEYSPQKTAKYYGFPYGGKVHN